MTKQTSPTKVDRRVQRTKQLLTEALMTLIAQKGYESITVQNIIDHANVGRSTFYAHYQDKEDLLLSGMKILVRHLLDGVQPELQEKGENIYLLNPLLLFEHTAENYELHRALVGGQGIHTIIQSLQFNLSHHIQERIEQIQPKTAVPPVIIAQYLAGTLLTLLRWWLDQRMPYTPKEMEQMYHTLTQPTIRKMLGRG